jgi:hypothetical protein
MTVSRLFNAAIHALAPDAPPEAFVGDGPAAQPMTPETIHLEVEGRLPAFDGATTWLNSPPLTPAGLRGKVVLVEFWTYTCINWLRTLPYVRAWDEKYRDHGLVTIGVSSPEFSFEHDVDNVRRALKDMRMGYPIAVDNDFRVWRAFTNHFWPAIYVADADGQLRYHNFGEGAYENTEMVIQHLLAAAGYTGIGDELVSGDARGIEVAADWDNLQSPETYVGYGRGDSFASPGGAAWNSLRAYDIPEDLQLNEWALAGEWTVKEEPAVLNTAGGRIAFRFHARDLHLVLAPPATGTPVRFRVTLDGRAPGAAHGSDVDGAGNGTVTVPRLYQLIRQPEPIDDRLFEIEFLDPGVEALVFTFG